MPTLDSTASGLIPLCVVLLLLSTLSLVGRLLARYRQCARFGPDDYLAVASWIVFVGLIGLLSYAMKNRLLGYPEPKNKVEVADDHYWLSQIENAQTAINIVDFGLVKLSALFYYRRLFCPVGLRDVLNFVNIVFIVLVVCWTIILEVLWLNVCHPHSISWEEDAGNNIKCDTTGQPFAFEKAYVATDFIFELLILLLPIQRIASLRISFPRKVAVACVFLLAIVGLAASIARLVIIIGLVTNRPVGTEDGYAHNTQAAFYGVLESGFTIIAINLPSTWYFVGTSAAKRALETVLNLISRHDSRSGLHGDSSLPKSSEKSSPSMPDVDSISLDNDHESEYDQEHGQEHDLEAGQVKSKIEHSIEEV